MILDIDYKFRDDLKEDTVPIELMTYSYEGVIYRYTVVKVEENSEKNEAKLIFDYAIMNPGKHTEEDLKKDKRFQKHIGIILNAMILQVADAPEDVDTTEYVEE